MPWQRLKEEAPRVGVEFSGNGDITVDSASYHWWHDSGRRLTSLTTSA